MDRKILAILGAIVVTICQMAVTFHYPSWNNEAILVGGSIDIALLLWAARKAKAHN